MHVVRLKLAVHDNYTSGREISLPITYNILKGNKMSYFNKIFLLLFLLVSMLAVGIQSQVSAEPVQQGCVSPANEIVAENCQPGNPPSEWEVMGAGDASIQGFATDISVNQGETVNFKVATDATDYRIDIYRIGYYNGDGARKQATIQPSAALPQTQPACLNDAVTGLIDCDNWTISAAWAVPANAVSGVYIAKLVREDPEDGHASHMIFIVRDDDGNSDLLFQTADTTWQAYNQYGGNSLYTGSPVGRAYKVSYNRPFTTRACCSEDWFFNAEYPMIRWLERNGYDVSYFTGVDTDRYGAELLEHKVFLSVGHDEYWSGAQRANVEAARDHATTPVNLAFFSSNEIFWKTRWETDADGTAYRTLVSYKETHADAKIDPEANIWTGTWRDPRSFNPEGAQPENALTGQIFTVNCCTYPMTVPAADGKMRFWRNTDVATLTPEQVATLPDGTLGYEWDEALDNGFSPPGLVRLSTTTVNVPQYIQDYGSEYAAGTATHNLVMYRAASGSLVFGSGTLQWSWGLDSNHDRGNAAPDVRMQQATVNLFADMGVQPATLQNDLLPATPSTDADPPASQIAAPANNGTVQVGSTILISGTASDTGGGVVGGVEVSVDGGTTWRRANGREAWSLAWIPETLGTATLRTRAVDDSGNLETPGAGITVSIEPRTCPCTIFGALIPDAVSENDPNAVEVGIKFQSQTAGYITGIRFYKSAQNTGTHTGRLWTGTGTLLAEVTFANESPSGWQETLLPTPVAIDANITYLVSYHAPNGFYSEDENYFATSPYLSAPLQALQNGTDGANGVYRYGAGGVFPTDTYNASNYWVDVVFVENVGPDTTPPTVFSTVPVNGANGVNVEADMKAIFNEGIDPATLNGTTLELRDALNTPIPASVTYIQSSRTAVLNPSSALAYSTTYTVTLKGGGAGIQDLAGNALAADYNWSFTTAAAPPPPPDEGPGGPILVLSHTSNNFGRYFAEILRTEGLNAFTVKDISTVDATLLQDYQVVLLGEMPLTAAQVTMLTDWVNAGGNLIAMKPDKQLAGLLGLTDAGGTLSEGYLLINSAGIVNETIQFHGTADLYNLNGASSLATLYTNATTSANHPAVTLHTVGSGQAATFTFDLARSVVYTRQGNPAWSGQERDGVSPIRSNDLFYGNKAGDVQPDWIDLSKVDIPQADEQQRLLANLVLNMSNMPLPRFWYFPRGEKAVIVMTGDDHANGGTAGQFDRLITQSPTGCSVEDWECLRSTSYIYTNTPLSDFNALVYQSQGFEIAVHFNTGCADWTPSSIVTNFTDDLAAWKAKYTSLNNPQTNRTHCIAWSDWATQAKVQYDFGIRFDTNYYYWPPSWIQNSPGMFTGSGMPMRFADLDGTMIDVYQAVTQMTDESGQSYPFTADALLDKALGTEGYYGAFTTNMHTDLSNHPGANAIVASAVSRGVPVVSALQMLNWLDGRNGSSFGGLDWNGNTLTFTLSVGAGANGLQAMLPTQSSVGQLTGLTVNGDGVAYTTETIKGVEYALFNAVAGSYTAQYAVDTVAPVISNVQAVANLDNTATITWDTHEPASSVVQYGTVSGTLTENSSNPLLTTTHSVTLSGLTANTTYYFTVASTDAATNTAISAESSFVTPAMSLIDTTLADFNAGTPDANTSVVAVDDGALSLKAALDEEFVGTALPIGWFTETWNPGGTGIVNAGQLTVNEARTGTTALYSAGRVLEFTATFGVTVFQHVGFGTDYNDAPWAVISTGSTGGAIKARTFINGTTQETVILSTGTTNQHLYRIEWLPNSVSYYVDSEFKVTHSYSGSDPQMRVLVSELNGADSVAVQWLRMSPYASPAVFESRIFDAGGAANWNTISWVETLPAGTSIGLSYRTGNTVTPDGTWTAFTPVASSGSPLTGNSRYIQYRAELATTDPAKTPLLEQVAFGYNTGADTTPPTITNRTPAPDSANVALDTNVTVQFNEAMNGSTFTDQTFRLRAEGATQDIAALVTYEGATRTATLNPISDLAPQTQYNVTVAGTASDANGNPLGTDAGWSFTTVPVLLSVIDTTVADFSAGTPDPNTAITQTDDGEVTLKPTVGSEFSGTTIPSSWVVNSQAWTSGGSVQVAGGQMTVSGQFIATQDFFTAGSVLEFKATFTADSFQHIGLGNDVNNVALWAMFSTKDTTDKLYTRINNNGAVAEYEIPGSWLGTPHFYRIEWTATALIFSIDGTVVRTENVSVVSPMRPLISDYNNNAAPLIVDWLRMSPYASPAVFESRIFDVGNLAVWNAISWESNVPAGTTLTMSYRTGNTTIPDGTWTAFIPLATSGTNTGVTARYVQYRAELASSNPALTPILTQVALTYSLEPDTTPPTITNRTPEPDAVEVAYNADVSVQFSEPMDTNTLTPSTIRLREDGATNDVSASVTYDSLTRTVTLNPDSDLLPSTRYYVTVSSTVADVSGNPLGTNTPWSFVTKLREFVDTTEADFSAGIPDPTLALTRTTDGEVTLKPEIGAEFSGTALPGDWTTASWNTGSQITVQNGLLSVDGSVAYSNPIASAGHILEFKATFNADAYQHVGFASDLNTIASSWIMFSTFGTTNALYARVNNNGTTTDTLINGSWLDAPHIFRIWWNETEVIFYIDGATVHQQSISIPASMKAAVSDFNANALPVTVDWLRTTPYAPSGTFISRVFDAGEVVRWQDMSWNVALPPGTGQASFSYRIGNTAIPDGTWSAFTPVALSGQTLNVAARYIQYKADLTTTDLLSTPKVEQVVLRAGLAGVAPTITAINDVTVYEGETVNVAIAASDGDNDVLTLTIEVVDSNSAVVPETEYTFTDNGDGTGSFVWNTAPVGTSTATVSASDGLFIATEGFTIQVNALASLTGTLSLQGRTDYSGQVTVTVYQGTTLVTTFTPNANSAGEFTVTGLVPGIYDVYVKHPLSLAQKQSVTLLSGNNGVNFGELRTGDADGNNQIDAQDTAAVQASFNTTTGDANFNANADFNGDAVVNAVDFSLMVTNFAQFGDMP